MRYPRTMIIGIWDCVSVNWGPQHQYAIDPAFAWRSFRDETRLSEDLTVEYHFLPATGTCQASRR